MASVIRGGTRFRRALKRLPAEARAEIATALDAGIKEIQATAIAMAPVDKGEVRRALAMKGAIGKRDKGLRVEFGMRTRAQKRLAYHAAFIEFGTKGYSVAAKPAGRIGRDGKVKSQPWAARSIPSRPARPFMRPAMHVNIPSVRIKINAAVKRAIRSASRG